MRSATHGNEDGASSKERLLAAAAELFRKRGYTATTTRELARLVGLQKASLYYHIGKKEDLLYEIISASATGARRSIEEATQTAADPLTKLRTLITAHLESILADPDPHAIATLELRSLGTQRRQKIVAIRDEYQDLVRQVVLEGQRAGVLRTDVSGEYLTLALLSLLNWTPFWFSPKGPLKVQEVAGLLADLYLQGAQTVGTVRLQEHHSETDGTSKEARRGRRPNPIARVS